MTRKILLGLVIALLSSCKSGDYVGRYQLRHYPKTTFELKNDGTFEFTQINPNPYLHPLDHPDEYFFKTNGTWTVKDKQLIVTSFNEATTVRKPELIDSAQVVKKGEGEYRTQNFSTVTFYDVFGDTVNVLYGQFPDSSTVQLLHRSMRFFEWPNLSEKEFQVSDTIEFHFYGYEPLQFIRPDRNRRNFKFRLYPQRQGGIFDNRQFIITRNQIKDRGIKFERAKK